MSYYYKSINPDNDLNVKAVPSKIMSSSITSSSLEALQTNVDSPAMNTASTNSTEDDLHFKTVEEEDKFLYGDACALLEESLRSKIQANKLTTTENEWSDEEDNNWGEIPDSFESILEFELQTPVCDVQKEIGEVTEICENEAVRQVGSSMSRNLLPKREQLPDILKYASKAGYMKIDPKILDEIQEIVSTKYKSICNTGKICSENSEPAASENEISIISETVHIANELQTEESGCSFQPVDFHELSSTPQDNRNSDLCQTASTCEIGKGSVNNLEINQELNNSTSMMIHLDQTFPNNQPPSCALDSFPSTKLPESEECHDAIESNVTTYVQLPEESLSETISSTAQMLREQNAEKSSNMTSQLSISDIGRLLSKIFSDDISNEESSGDYPNAEQTNESASKIAELKNNSRGENLTLQSSNKTNTKNQTSVVQRSTNSRLDAIQSEADAEMNNFINGMPQNFSDHRFLSCVLNSVLSEKDHSKLSKNDNYKVTENNAVASIQLPKESSSEISCRTTQMFRNLNVGESSDLLSIIKVAKIVFMLNKVMNKDRSFSEVLIGNSNTEQNKKSMTTVVREKHLKKNSQTENTAHENSGKTSSGSSNHSSRPSQRSALDNIKHYKSPSPNRPRPSLDQSTLCSTGNRCLKVKDERRHSNERSPRRYNKRSSHDRSPNRSPSGRRSSDRSPSRSSGDRRTYKRSRRHGSYEKHSYERGRHSSYKSSYAKDPKTRSDKSRNHNSPSPRRSRRSRSPQRSRSPRRSRQRNSNNDRSGNRNRRVSRSRERSGSRHRRSSRSRERSRSRSRRSSRSRDRSGRSSYSRSKNCDYKYNRTDTHCSRVVCRSVRDSKDRRCRREESESSESSFSTSSTDSDSGRSTTDSEVFIERRISKIYKTSDGRRMPLKPDNTEDEQTKNKFATRHTIRKKSEDLITKYARNFP